MCAGGRNPSIRGCNPTCPGTRSASQRNAMRFCLKLGLSQTSAGEVHRTPCAPHMLHAGRSDLHRDVPGPEGCDPMRSEAVAEAVAASASHPPQVHFRDVLDALIATNFKDKLEEGLPGGESQAAHGPATPCNRGCNPV